MVSDREGDVFRAVARERPVDDPEWGLVRDWYGAVGARCEIEPGLIVAIDFVTDADVFAAWPRCECRALDLERVKLLRLAAVERKRGVRRVGRLRAQRKIRSVRNEAPRATRFDPVLRGRAAYPKHQCG